MCVFVAVSAASNKLAHTRGMINGLGYTFGHFSQGAVLWLMYGCVSVEIYATRAVLSFRALGVSRVWPGAPGHIICALVR